MADLKPDVMDQDDIVMDDIIEDMTVVDSQGDTVGDIDFIRFGEGHEVASVSSAVSMKMLTTTTTRLLILR